MVIQKKKITQLLLGLEVAFFAISFLISKNGLPAINRLISENRMLEIGIENIKNDVGLLEYELIAWHKFSYYREKIAREQLHMARKNETIYVIS